jgi:hypothetical protein
MNDFDENVIFAFTRAQALEDGVLMEVSQMAREAGFCVPVALTAAVWQECVKVPDACPWQDERGRLWDVLTVLRWSANSAGDRQELKFFVAVQNDELGPREIELKAVCGPGDEGEPVITILLPDED